MKSDFFMRVLSLADFAALRDGFGGRSSCAVLAVAFAASAARGLASAGGLASRPFAAGAARAARPAFSAAARSMIFASIAPASPPFGRAVRDPDVGIVGGEDVLEVAVALHAAAARTR